MTSIAGGRDAWVEWERLAPDHAGRLGSPLRRLVQWSIAAGPRVGAGPRHGNPRDPRTSLHRCPDQLDSPGSPRRRSTPGDAAGEAGMIGRPGRRQPPAAAHPGAADPRDAASARDRDAGRRPTGPEQPRAVAPTWPDLGERPVGETDGVECSRPPLGSARRARTGAPQGHRDVVELPDDWIRPGTRSIGEPGIPRAAPRLAGTAEERLPRKPPDSLRYAGRRRRVASTRSRGNGSSVTARS